MGVPFQQERRDRLVREGLAYLAEGFVGLAAQVAFKLKGIADDFVARDSHQRLQFRFRDGHPFRWNDRRRLPGCRGGPRHRAARAQGIGREENQDQDKPEKQRIHQVSPICPAPVYPASKTGILQDGVVHGQ